MITCPVMTFQMSRDRSKLLRMALRGPTKEAPTQLLFRLGKETSSFRILCSVVSFLNHGRRTKIKTWIVLVSSFILQNTVHLEKAIVRHLVKNLQKLMECRCLLPCSQELATCPYRKPDESTPRHPISLRFGLMVSANLRLGLPSSLLPSGAPTKFCVRFFSPPCTSQAQP
jgi:hypothetical protein